MLNRLETISLLMWSSLFVTASACVILGLSLTGSGWVGARLLRILLPVFGTMTLGYYFILPPLERLLRHNNHNNSKKRATYK